MREATTDRAAARKRSDGQSRILGSLREALAAAGKADSEPTGPLTEPPPLASLPAPTATLPGPPAIPHVPSVQAADAGPALHQPAPPRVVADVAPTTQATRPARNRTDRADTSPARTQLIRGKRSIARDNFSQDPVVGWLVVIGGKGLGSFRPIFEGNNAIGRSASQRIPIDFGDEAISSEEQAYIRYDSQDRSFLFVPNLAKTNVVSVDGRKPTGAVALKAMDVITMGRTQLVFVPFCGAEFDWSELEELKG